MPASALASSRVRELILGQLVYVLPISKASVSYTEAKWLSHLDRISESLAAHCNSREQDGDTQGPPKRAISYLTTENLKVGEHFELDDMYYTYDLLNGFLCESDTISEEVLSSSSEDTKSDISDHTLDVCIVVFFLLQHVLISS